jgi:hypothetical protein
MLRQDSWLLEIIQRSMMSLASRHARGMSFLGALEQTAANPAGA